MAKLILSMDGLVLREIPLDKERISMGRKPHNDIQIDNLAISGEHAVIITLLNDSFLEDLNSTNGTYVNGQPIKKHFLQNGDVVELGKYRLKYVNEVAPETVAADFEKTVALRPEAVHSTVEQAAIKGFGETRTGGRTTDPGAGASLTATAPRSDAATAPPRFAATTTTPRFATTTTPPSQPMPATPSRAAIQILTGGNAGKELELTKTLTTLGKQGVQVVVIARRPQGYFMTHVEGARCPVVAGEKLVANKPHPLNDHDIIELGGVKMEFFLKG
jgi:pSer/pThr/pTyr-binding forkhead associated (FHA) protein